ncbi:hypothetical protein CFC21_101055 [Triticum aestivum]|uniref:F-box domain-containing protein n=2 Tax=Triticum aestivum TaxID=4565 RepID=A0A3B6S856_WHEAT|nr:hypothetical protein CFC21_101055 [Triticum aestivum]
MEPIKPTATLTGKIRESADDGDAASGTIGSLPFHLTEKILGCISPLESVRFAAVCRSWAEIISERLARPTPHLFALEVLDEGLRGAIFSIPIDDGGEDSPAPVVPARLPSTVSDAKHFELCGVLPSGRISFAYKSSLVLVNPATGAVRGIQTYAHRIMYPTEPMFCSGAEAFFIGQSFGRNFSLWWCTEGEWSERKLLLPEDLKCADDIDLVAYSDGVFYAMQIFGSTYTIDTRAPMPWRLTRLSVPSIREQLGDRFIRNFHLLESEGEVMFVVRVLATQEPAYSNSFGGYEVYRLDVEGARWVKVERLAGEGWRRPQHLHGIEYFQRIVPLLWCEEDELVEQKLFLPKEFRGTDAIGFVAYANSIFYAVGFYSVTHIIDMRVPLPHCLTRLRAPSILDSRAVLSDLWLSLPPQLPPA